MDFVGDDNGVIFSLFTAVWDGESMSISDTLSIDIERFSISERLDLKSMVREGNPITYTN